MKNKIIFFLWIFISVGTQAPGQDIPARPALPEYMYGMTDTEFGEKFFEEINLEHPSMKQVKKWVNQKNYSQALHSWYQTFCARMRNLSCAEDYPPFRGWTSGQLNSSDLLLKEETVIMKHQISMDLGLPFGQEPFAPREDISQETLEALAPINQPGMRWHRPDSYDLHAHLMWHPGAIIRFNERVGNRQNWSREKQEASLRRWTAIWRDYANNSWRIGMYLHKNPAAKQAALDYYKIEKPILASSDNWLCDVYWRQPLVVIWQGQNFIFQTHHAFANFPDLFEHCTDARSMAEIVYFLVVWNFQNAAANCGKGPANQRITNSCTLLDCTQMLPEFKRVEKMKPLLNADIESLIGQKKDASIFPDLGLDGAGSENSYNYMFGTTNEYNRFLNLTERIDEDYPWKEYLKLHLSKRIEFQRNIGTPTGKNLVLCKGSANRRSHEFPYKYVDQQPPEDYTSIAFRYHGLFILRNDWSREALYLALHNVRRGAGHESEDGNKITVEAYGRSMLVSNPGEGGLFGSSWGHNTVNIDTLGQSRRRLPRHGVYDTFVPGEWKTSAKFDDVTTIYQSGYGTKQKKYRYGEVHEPILHTQHVRRIFFDKIAKVWIIIDTMIPEDSDKDEHIYTQIWNLASDFPISCVKLDPMRNHFYTQDAGKPNLHVWTTAFTTEQTSPKTEKEMLEKTSPKGVKNEIRKNQNAFPNQKDYLRLFYAHGWEKPEKAGTETVLTSIPETAAGWVNNGSGYSGSDVVPAPTVHARFKAAGTLRIISVLVPSPDDNNPIKNIRWGEKEIIVTSRWGTAKVSLY
ncbi:MAG: heparinase II/III family protein [Planctomycetia bacterium]|nr:heparinase II/III family protein [Planctomycetia bacterium]